jgi:hypothetical protein
MAGDMAGSIDRLTVGPRDPRGYCSFHRIAGVARRPCGVDLPARRVAGHCPGDGTAAAVDLVDWLRPVWRIVLREGGRKAPALFAEALWALSTNKERANQRCTLNGAGINAAHPLGRPHSTETTARPFAPHRRHRTRDLRSSTSRLIHASRPDEDLTMRQERGLSHASSSMSVRRCA